MIKTDNLTTTVSFARKNEKGTISVQAFHNKLILQQLKTEKKVSDKLEIEDIQDLPKIVCDFQSTQSVDVMIAILERIKMNMTSNPYNFAQAC